VICAVKSKSDQVPVGTGRRPERIIERYSRRPIIIVRRPINIERRTIIIVRHPIIIIERRPEVIAGLNGFY